MQLTRMIEAIRSGMLQHGRLVKLDTPLGPDFLLPQRVYGRSRIGRNYELVVDAVHVSSTFRPRKLMAQPVTLWIQQDDRSYLPHHGYVSSVTRLGSDGDLHAVQFTITSWLHFLHLRSDARNWQDATVEGILSDVFYEHSHARGAFRFELTRSLPARSFVQQYESDWNFVHRLMEEEGLFFYFEQAKDGQSHTMVIVDDVSAFPQANAGKIPLLRSDARIERDGFTRWEEIDGLHSTQHTTRTSDYKRPASATWPKGTSVSATGADSLPWQAEVYEYTGAYTFLDRYRGDALSWIRVQQWESAAQRVHGTGNIRCLDAGLWFELTRHPERGGRDSDQQWQYIAIETVWGIENNLPVSFATRDVARSLKASIEALRAEHGGEPDALAVRHADGGMGLFVVQVEVQRKALAYRSPFEHRKPVMQLQTATVVGPDNEEVFTDSLNRIRVRFHWDRLNGDTPRASCWVRTAFADAGGGKGAVHVPRVGEEVLIGWESGDCDRPIAIGRVYNGANQPPWHTNGILSGIQSREYGGQGYNMLVMDDSTGQPRLQLASSSASAHVHLGYLIEQTGNRRGAYLGSGFDVKADTYGALRAGRGLYVSTHPIAAQPLDARPANSQLVNSVNVIQALSDASTQHQAEDMAPGHDTLKSFTDATKHTMSGVNAGGRTAGGGTGEANAFGEPIMLLASPSGIGLATQQSVHVASNAHTNIVSGQNTHLAAGRSLIASVAEKLSLFVQNAGMKLFAAKGKIQVQAHSDDVEISAQKAIRLASVTNNIEAAAKEEILLTAGGAYIRLSGGNIEIHAPGKIDVKGAQHVFGGPAQMSVDHPAFPTNMPTTPLMLNVAGSPSASTYVPAGMPYKLLADGATVKQGVLDASGQVPVDHHVTTQKYSLQLANGITHEIPVPAAYRDAANGALANQGFHFHEGLPGTEAAGTDRAVHRQNYADLLSGDTENQ